MITEETLNKIINDTPKWILDIVFEEQNKYNNKPKLILIKGDACNGKE